MQSVFSLEPMDLRT